MDFKDRLKEESKQLSDKIDKLESFVESEALDKIDEIQKSLLIVQLNAMITYAHCLDRRIYNLK